MAHAEIVQTKHKQPKFKFKLFWKILLWFWISLVLIVTTHLFIAYVSSDKPHYRPLPPPVEKELYFLTTKVKKIVKRTRRDNLAKKMLWNAFLLDQSSTEIFNRDVPEVLLDLHSRVLRQGRLLSVRQNREGYFGGTKIEVKGQTYYVYSRHTAPRFTRHILGNFFRDFARSLLVVTFLISFPLSFVLSWLITRPIRRLQDATNQLSRNLKQSEEIQKLSQRSDEFGELARDFDQMGQHLSTTLRSQKQLLSDVSHELRSPLTRLQIALGLAERNASIEAKEQLARIKKESIRMNEMLENLLALSKLDSDEISAQKELIDFCPLVRMVIEDARFEAEQADICIDLALPEKCRFSGVKSALISGIENIVRNAIRYAGQGGKITCGLYCDNDSILLTIEDTGPGLPEEQLDKIFDAFYRPDFDRNRASGGAGLGLSIAKRAFAINNGAISASNIQPHGLKVEVRFMV
ncbi:MAG: ATP-binding protein [Kangiellaceae bacterium]|nr:ATP-binding protein [Kangiellaceae bacterium]MCW8999151.1 ATP-binding protein [Kangiellaceae bacterium]